MSKTSLLRIQKSIYDTLTGNAPLMLLINGVFDNVVEGQLLPYIEIGEATETRFNTFDTDGREVTENIMIYSQYAGYKEGLEIFDLVMGLLDYKTLIITDYSLVYSRYEDGSTLMESLDQGKTRRISSRFRFIVQEV